MLRRSFMKAFTVYLKSFRYSEIFLIPSYFSCIVYTFTVHIKYFPYIQRWNKHYIFKRRTLVLHWWKDIFNQKKISKLELFYLAFLYNLYWLLKKTVLDQWSFYSTEDEKARLYNTCYTKITNNNTIVYSILTIFWNKGSLFDKCP